MKKVLNVFGVLFSIILTILLFILTLIYIVILNVKFILSENGMQNIFKNIDVVEVIKYTDDTAYENFMEISEALDLSESEFKQILNNDKLKAQISDIISKTLKYSIKGEKLTITQGEIINFLNIAIDEYNNVSDNKIDEKERREILNLIDSSIVENINSEINSFNLKETLPQEYEKYIKIVDGILYGNYSLIILVIIICDIILIALFRFSYYKWMPYVAISTMINGILILIIGLLILYIPLENIEMLLPIKKLFSIRILLISLILIILSVTLFIAKKYLKKYVDNKINLIDLEKNM